MRIIQYLASKYLKINDKLYPKIPGAGVFKNYHVNLQLTAKNSLLPSLWELPKWMYPSEDKKPLSFHNDIENRWSLTDFSSILKTVGRGQEFVLDYHDYPESERWLINLLSLQSFK